MHKYKSFLSLVAPTLAKTIFSAGGPISSLAFSMIANKVLGKNTIKPKELEGIIKNITPKQLEQIKDVELELKAKLKELDIKVETVNANDRKDARMHNRQTKEYVPAILSFFISIGFFSIVSLIMFTNIDSYSKDILNIMIGTLGAAFTSVISYYFGSSSAQNQAYNLNNEQKAKK